MPPKFGFLITAFQQIDLTRKNIERIRNEYKFLHNCDIIVVTTSPQDVGFDTLATDFKNVHVINFRDAPGTEGSTFVTKSNAPSQDMPGGIWRYNFLAARILYSMKKGLVKAKELGLDAILHLHSDTYWQSDKESILVAEMYNVIDDNLLFSGDCAESFERHKRIPPNMNFCPEGIIFNVGMCIRTGFSDFEKIYEGPNKNFEFVNKDEYWCKDYVGIEIILGTWAMWRLCGKNMLDVNDEVPELFRRKVKCRSVRAHHNSFPDGLVNLPQTQPTHG